MGLSVLPHMSAVSLIEIAQPASLRTTGEFAFDDYSSCAITLRTEPQHIGAISCSKNQFHAIITSIAFCLICLQ